MGEKRFTLNLMKKPSEIEMDGKMISKYDVVRLLNTLHQENQELKKKNNALKEDINQSEKRVKHWMMLYGDVYDKMQKRRVSG